MTILQLTSHLGVGGITRYVLTLSEQLAARGHRVIVASDHGAQERHLLARGLPYWCVPLHTSAEFSLPVWRSYGLLLARLQQEPVDLIHAHTRVAQVVADRLSQHLRIPYVTTWHGIFKRRLGRRVWPCTGLVTVAISEPVRHHLIKDFGVPEARVRCIPNGIDPLYYSAAPSPDAVAAFRRQAGLPAGCPVIGGLGRLAAGRVKGFDLLLIAAQLLQQSFPALHTLVVGDGPRRPFLEDIAERLGIRSRVHFVGTAEDVRVPLAAMDVFVFPSRWPEGFGLTLIEAMAAGKAVIGTRMGAVGDIIRHEVDGLLVPPEHPVALAEAIARLLGQRDVAQRLGQSAQTRVREQFSLERMTRQVETVYEEVLGRTAARP